MTNSNISDLKPKFVPPLAAATVAGVQLLVWFLGKMQLIPGLNEFLQLAPPWCPPPIIVVTLSTAILMWSFNRERNRLNPGLRCVRLIGLAAIMFAVYFAILPYLSQLPLAQREGGRKQIGFHMYVLSDKAHAAIQRGSLLKPPKEYRTPNDLLYGFGVWGGQGEVSEIWPMWTIIASGIILHATFLLSCALWAYGLGAILRLLYTAEPRDDVPHRTQTYKGHFLCESGCHSDRWLDFDYLFADAKATRGWACALAERVRNWEPQVVCGVHVGAARIAQQMAEELNAVVVFAERRAPSNGSVEYRLSETVCESIRDRRVVIVEDVEIASFALATVKSQVQSCRGETVGFASVISVGRGIYQMSTDEKVPCEVLHTIKATMWTAQNCPMCRAGNVLMDELSIKSGEHTIAAIQMVPRTQDNN